jgi:hypothetical protein
LDRFPSPLFAADAQPARSAFRAAMGEEVRALDTRLGNVVA